MSTKQRKYGLDFGTTNTSIAIEKDGVGEVLALDLTALDSRVIRTMLYFLKREMIISPKVPQKRRNAQTFFKHEITYQGEQEMHIGQEAVNSYIYENTFRKPGKTRKILTGKMIKVASGADPVQEYYWDIDYGTGRFMQAIKTALKSPLYKGTSIFGNFYTLEDLIASYVGEIKSRADQKLGHDIAQVVVGRPVHFSDDTAKDRAAQDRLEHALRQVGFKEVSFVFEPVAAAEQFITSQQKKSDQLVFVFDFGGGTLDTAIVQAGQKSRVLAADGVYIGGDLLNADIVESKLWGYFGYYALWGDQHLTMPRYIYENLGSWYSIPLLNNPQTMLMFEKVRYQNTNPQAIERLQFLIKANLGFDLYEAVEVAKKQLSRGDEAKIIFKNDPIDINIMITREEFEQIIQSRVEKIRETILKTLTQANVEPSQIDVVVRTGGSSLIPVFENLLVEIFGKEKIKQFETFTSIAAGLALS